MVSNVTRSMDTSKGERPKTARTRASVLDGTGSLVTSFEHLSGVPDTVYALNRLRQIASLVRPIMRAHRWSVGVLSEFLPPDQRLLGVNVNRGQKICLRLRYTHNPSSFLPMEEVADTMLHELCHIVHGPHDGSFHALWEQLRDEHESLVVKGYTGTNFLSKGHTLGGSAPSIHPSADTLRAARQQALSRLQGTGHRLGGERIPLGQDHRRAIADKIERRLTQQQGCASGNAGASELADNATKNTFKTEADESDANDRAIAEALVELMLEEEAMNLKSPVEKSARPNGALHESRPSQTDTQTLLSEEAQLEWALRESAAAVDEPESLGSPDSVNDATAPPAKRPRIDIVSEEDGILQTSTVTIPRPVMHDVPGLNVPQKVALKSSQFSDMDTWTCDHCTCINPAQYLACDACGLEKFTPSMTKSAATSLQKIERESKRLEKPTSLGWTCEKCSTFMEHKWWTCSLCGAMKNDSKVNEHV